MYPHSNVKMWISKASRKRNRSKYLWPWVREYFLYIISQNTNDLGKIDNWISLKCKRQRYHQESEKIMGKMRKKIFANNISNKEFV